MSHTGGSWKAVLTNPAGPGARNAIVSDDGADASYDKESLDYGGTLIAEAVLLKNMPLLLRAPSLLAACKRARAFYETALASFPENGTLRTELLVISELIAEADPPGPSKPPSAPPWP
jgi:hypothetical protein